MTPKEKSVRPHASISGRKQKLSAAARQELGREAGSGWSARRRLRRVDPRKRKKLLRQIGLRVNPARSGVRIVYNKLLGGWYIVRGPHQTPIGGRFDSRAQADAYLRDVRAAGFHPKKNPARREPIFERSIREGRERAAKAEAKAREPSARELNTDSREKALDIAAELEHDYSPNDLMKFWANHQRGRGAAKLIGTGSGSKTLTALLANFASNTATAQQTRKRGDISAAQMYEKIADTIMQEIQGVRRNPARYRGKHPFAIREVASMGDPGIAIVTANNGMRVQVRAKDVQGVMPKLREDIRKYMQPFERSIFENPARSREIVTLTGSRSRRVLGYATPDTSRAALDAAALRLANAHREPVKIERVKVQSLHASRTMPAPVRAYLANPARRKYIEIIGRKVIFSPDAVSDFKSVFPASGLRDRAYWFEFDSKGDLVDSDVPEHDDGAGAAALSEDAKAYLAGDTQTWMRARSNPAPLTRKGIYYFSSLEDAQQHASRFGFPRKRIIRYSFGWAIQLRAGGPYVGPRTKPYAKGGVIVDAAYYDNPDSSGIARAARRFTRFTGHKAERVEMLPFPERPAAGLAVGPVLMLGYSAMRDGKTENYLHKFAPHARPMLVASDDGKTLHILGGHFSFTERGIVDKRK